MEQINKSYLKNEIISASFPFYLLGSGSSVRTDVRVRVSPSAPLKNQGFSSRYWGKPFFSYVAICQ